jgi:hypothetical protein
VNTLLIFNINEKDLELIKNGNRSLLKKKLEAERDKYHKSVLLGKEDHRFYQGVCCTLMDILEML